jgi:gamma-glutamylcyclotransferase
VTKAPGATAQDYTFYFAYGSNMAVERITRRIPAAEKLCTAKLTDYCLQFHKVAQDGSGKCDIVPDTSPDAVVYGVLFKFLRQDFAEMDRIEGPGYKRITVPVTAESVGTVSAETYVAMTVDSKLLPYSWYKQHVLRGAIASELPAAYIANLEAVPSVEDPDRARHAREIAIYAD